MDWQESFQKALRSLETGLDGFSLPKGWKKRDADKLVFDLRVPNPDRMMVIKQVRTHLVTTTARHNDLLVCTWTLPVFQS